MPHALGMFFISLVKGLRGNKFGTSKIEHLLQGDCLILAGLYNWCSPRYPLRPWVFVLHLFHSF